jgi:hypothetical protein
MEPLKTTFYSWNGRGYALIFITPKLRYFMHISECDSDRLPIVREKVSIGAPAPRKEGQLPCAVNVKPVVVTAWVTYVC